MYKMQLMFWGKKKRTNLYNNEVMKFRPINLVGQIKNELQEN